MVVGHQHESARLINFRVPALVRPVSTWIPHLEHFLQQLRFSVAVSRGPGCGIETVQTSELDLVALADKGWLNMRDFCIAHP